MSQDRESKLQRANVYRPVVFLTAQERRQNKFVWFLGKTGFFYIFEPLKQNHLRGEKKKNTLFGWQNHCYMQHVGCQYTLC